VSGGRDDRAFVVVDVGSNSVRIMFGDGLPGPVPPRDRVTTVTSLRRGAAPDGSIAPDALERLDDCLRTYGRMMREAGATHGVALGTSAVRDAPNRAEVAALVERRLGIPLTVLTGQQEARLAFEGARTAMRGDAEALVLDVGGASTELVRGGPGGLRAAVSLQLGGVRSTEAHLHADPPAPAELDALRAEARDVGGSAPLVGVAGTVTTLAAVRLGRYDPDLVHGMRLTRADVDGILARLAALPLARRREVPGLEPARAPVIVAGALIVGAAMEAAGAGDLMVSERDLLDGAAGRLKELASPVRDRGPGLAGRPATS
jgi:exopolyphosphatase/guanosine-5'-triphosphate,3'-diphosphate pyrophosphatase